MLASPSWRRAASTRPGSATTASARSALVETRRARPARSSDGAWWPKAPKPSTWALFQRARKATHANVTLVVVNSKDNIGSATPSEKLIVQSASDDAASTLAHELGHALLDLADEYDYGICDLATAGARANVTKTPKNPPWKAFFEKLPVEGAELCAKGVWRPQEHCLMRQLNARSARSVATSWMRSSRRVSTQLPHRAGARRRRHHALPRTARSTRLVPATRCFRDAISSARRTAAALAAVVRRFRSRSSATRTTTARRRERSARSR